MHEAFKRSDTVTCDYYTRAVISEQSDISTFCVAPVITHNIVRQPSSKQSSMAAVIINQIILMRSSVFLHPMPLMYTMYDFHVMGYNHVLL